MRSIRPIFAFVTLVTIVATIPLAIPAANPQTTQTRSTLKPDLKLLLKATESFLKGNTFQTESITEINGVGKTTNFKTQFQTVTIAQAPDRFRAEIVLAPVGKQNPARRTIVVCDGQTVWIYRPDRKEYVALKYRDFDRRNDTFAVGMSSLLYLAIAPELQPLAAKGALSDQTVQAQLNSLATADLKGGNQKINGEDLFVYEFADRQNRFSYVAAINPIDAVLKQVQLKGNSQDLSITMVETIQKRTANPEIPADAFRFTPPKQTKQVKSLEIVPL